MSHRISQVNELVLQELNNLILTEVEFPKECLATITFVETSKDLRHAKIGVSVLPVSYTKKVLDIFKHNIGHLQFLLNKKLRLKPLPRLSFVIDETEKRAAEVEEIINQALEDLGTDKSA